MAVAHALTDTTADIASATATVTVTKPTGAGASHICCVIFGTSNAVPTTTTMTGPAGTTRLSATVLGSNGTSRVKLDAFWFLGTQSSLGFTNSNNGGSYQQGWVCAAFTGVDLTTPVDVELGAGVNNSGANSISVTAITIVTDQAMDCIASADFLGGNQTVTSFTRSQNASANSSATLNYNTTLKSVGTTGAATLSDAAGTSGQIIDAIRWAWRPAAAGGTDQPMAKRWGAVPGAGDALGGGQGGPVQLWRAFENAADWIKGLRTREEPAWLSRLAN